jgi:PIN domain nuclease of toxin-antitoxin system
MTTLPLHPKDPFDRLFAATALIEGMTLGSAAPAFYAYGVNRLR